MTKLGKFFLHTGCWVVWEDGNGMSFYWRWYHPVTWVFAPLFFLLNILIAGIPETLKYSHEVGFGVSPYWKKNKDSRKYL